MHYHHVGIHRWKSPIAIVIHHWGDSRDLVLFAFDSKLQLPRRLDPLLIKPKCECVLLVLQLCMYLYIYLYRFYVCKREKIWGRQKWSSETARAVKRREKYYIKMYTSHVFFHLKYACRGKSERKKPLKLIEISASLSFKVAFCDL